MRPRFLSACLLAFLVLAGRPRARADDSAESAPVVVFDIQNDGVTGAGVGELSEVVGQFVAARGYALVPASDVHRVVAERERKIPTCVVKDPCRRSVAHELQAQLVVSGTLARGPKFATLYLALARTDRTDEPGRISVVVNTREELAAKAEEALRRLFHWTGAPAAPAPRIVSHVEAIPPLEDRPSPAPAPPPVAPLSSPGSPRARRLMVLDLRAIDVDPAAVAPLANLVAAEIGGHPGYDVASADDVRRMLQTQATKLVAGCTQDEACLVEISRKSNADLIVNGSVGKVGHSIVLSLSLVDPKNPGGSARASQAIDGLQELPGAVRACVGQLFHWTTTAAPAFHLPKDRKSLFAIFDLKPTGLSADAAQNLTAMLSTEVKGVEGASVVGRDDVTAMLQLQQVKMASGCDDAGCMAEIGGALGVDRLITGDAGKLGATFIINLRLIDVRHGVVENRVTESFEGDEEQLLRAVRKAGRDLLGLGTDRKGQLAVTASQNEAKVVVDDAVRGPAPARVMDLTPGKHAVRVTSSGFFDWHGDVYVDPLETTSVWAQLGARPQAWYQKWWIWTIVGVAVVGGTTGAVVGTRAGPTTGHIGVELP